ncbi:hypothetical protein K438DRAFT_2077169 [Mycena galopus ATCC 62051]|nr:hypothetical protein K438DRAFT_2077169 [Mycena galopus ATCC 62051]
MAGGATDLSHTAIAIFPTSRKVGGKVEVSEVACGHEEYWQWTGRHRMGEGKEKRRKEKRRREGVATETKDGDGKSGRTASADVRTYHAQNTEHLHSRTAPPPSRPASSLFSFAASSTSCRCGEMKKGRRARGTTPTLHHYLVPILASSRPHPRALTTTRVHALRRYTSSQPHPRYVRAERATLVRVRIRARMPLALELTDTCTARPNRPPRRRTGLTEEPTKQEDLENRCRHRCAGRARTETK